MRYLYILLFVFNGLTLFAQEEAWLYFNAKPNSHAFLNNPLDMLSQRALDRRNNQKIPLNFTDVPIEKEYLTQLKAREGITVLAQSKWLNAVHIRGSVSDILALNKISFVEKIDFADKTLNLTSKKVVVEKSKNTAANFQPNIVYDYGSSANQIMMLNGAVLHEHNYTGSGKIIAVIDAGFPGVNTTQPFERVRTNNQILGGYDFVSRTENFYTKSDHGTKVLSTIVGFKEGKVVGTAPDASFYLFITEDDPYEGPLEESLWVEAAERADSLGVDIITTSLGYFGKYTNPKYSHTYSDMDGKTTFISRGANLAFAKGIFVLASGGNEGNTAEKHIGAPADAFDVLTVGAVTAAKIKTGFSSIGPSFDNRIKPDVMAQGQTVYAVDHLGTIVTVNGTSFSCPIMAGAIACLWQAFPEKSNREIRDLVIASADRFSNPDNEYGYGIPDFAFAAGTILALKESKNNDFVMYPNPTSNEVNFAISDKENNASVFIYSVLGKKIFETKITTEKNAISFQELPKGVYFYKITGADFEKSGKIIKQ